MSTSILSCFKYSFSSKVITVIKFDKEGNKIQEKKIEEKPLSFPKAPELNKHILAAASNRSPTPKSPVSPSSTAKSPSSPTTKAKESEKIPPAESPTPKNAVVSPPPPTEAGSGGSSRVIPIKIVGNGAGNTAGGNNVAQKTAKVKKSAEVPLKTRIPSGEGSLTRNIPINVEGRGLIESAGKLGGQPGHSVSTGHPSGHSATPVTPETAEEAAEGMDSLGRPISRRRWGSRKKRFSSAYSDSSMSDGGEVRFFAKRYS